MTKLVKKLLISLMALVMIVCCGFALLGTQPVMAKAETETHGHCACGTTHQAIGSHTDEEEITWTPWDGTTEYKASGVTSYVYLSDDVVLDGTIYVDNNYTLYFCLNGKKLTAKSTDFRAFSVRGGGTLILTDCGTNVRQGYIDAKTHLWTDGEANVSEGDIEYNITGGVIAGFDFSSEGGSIFVSKGKLYTYGVNICGNKTSSNDYGGGAVYISTDSTAELNNTTISGNVSPSIGSGLVAANNAMVTMNKCTFNNNHINAPTNKYPDGGCVSVNKNSTSTATLTMKNCVLENNSSINRGYTAMTVNGIANLEDCEIINNKGYNGAILVLSQSQLNLKNTTIKNNISNVGSAGGMYCRSCTINLSGRIVIADNTSSESNVYVDGDFKINIVGDGLEEGSLIGIFPHYFTYGQVANHTNFVLVSQNDVDYSSCFISDRPESYHVEYNSDGNIIITNGKTEIYTVTFDVNGVECTAPTAQTINVGGKAKQPTLSNVDGYNVVGWYTDSACTNEFSFDTAITEDITLYAKWGISYDVWVAGIRLDSTNTTIDNNDNSTITGTATYDATSNTLTLDNFSYSGADYYLYESVYDSEYDEYYYDYACIYSKGDLNIVLNGENTLNCAIIDEDPDNIYSKGLPQFFISDIMDDDIVCTIGLEDKKLLLFDNFVCWDEGEYIGEVSADVIKRMRKSN